MVSGRPTGLTICTILDCPKSFVAKGLCRFHYEKQYRTIHRDHQNLLQRIRNHKNLEKRRNQTNTWHRNNRHKIRIWEMHHRENNRILYNEKYKKYWNKVSELIHKSPKQIKFLLWNWSKIIKKRDQNLCVICSLKAHHSHHIFPKILYPGLTFNINNGISLCHDHHWETHRLN